MAAVATRLRTAMLGTIATGLVVVVTLLVFGLLAYWLCRAFGRVAARRIAGDAELRRGEQVFSEVGGWMVALSRWLPLLPEVITCMAGLTRMPFLPFCLALATGSVPMAFTFAVVGDLGTGSPTLTLALSAGLPLIIWPLAHFWLKRSRRRGEISGEESS